MIATKKLYKIYYITVTFSVRLSYIYIYIYYQPNDTTTESKTIYINGPSSRMNQLSMDIHLVYNKKLILFQ